MSAQNNMWGGVDPSFEDEIAPIITDEEGVKLIKLKSKVWIESVRDRYDPQAIVNAIHGGNNAQYGMQYGGSGGQFRQYKKLADYEDNPCWNYFNPPIRCSVPGQHFRKRDEVITSHVHDQPWKRVYEKPRISSQKEFLNELRFPQFMKEKRSVKENLSTLEKSNIFDEAFSPTMVFQKSGEKVTEAYELYDEIPYHSGEKLKKLEASCEEIESQMIETKKRALIELEKIMQSQIETFRKHILEKVKKQRQIVDTCDLEEVNDKIEREEVNPSDESTPLTDLIMKCEDALSIVFSYFETKHILMNFCPSSSYFMSFVKKKVPLTITVTVNVFDRVPFEEILSGFKIERLQIIEKEDIRPQSVRDINVVGGGYGEPSKIVRDSIILKNPERIITFLEQHKEDLRDIQILDLQDRQIVDEKVESSSEELERYYENEFKMGLYLKLWDIFNKIGECHFTNRLFTHVLPSDLTGLKNLTTLIFPIEYRFLEMCSVLRRFSYNAKSSGGEINNMRTNRYTGGYRTDIDLMVLRDSILEKRLPKLKRLVLVDRYGHESPEGGGDNRQGSLRPAHLQLVQSLYDALPIGLPNLEGLETRVMDGFAGFSEKFIVYLCTRVKKVELYYFGNRRGGNNNNNIQSSLSYWDGKRKELETVIASDVGRKKGSRIFSGESLWVHEHAPLEYHGWSCENDIIVHTKNGWSEKFVDEWYGGGAGGWGGRKMGRKEEKKAAEEKEEEEEKGEEKSEKKKKEDNDVREVMITMVEPESKEEVCFSIRRNCVLKDGLIRLHWLEVNDLKMEDVKFKYNDAEIDLENDTPNTLKMEETSIIITAEIVGFETESSSIESSSNEEEEGEEKKKKVKKKVKKTIRKRRHWEQWNGVSRSINGRKKKRRTAEEKAILKKWKKVHKNLNEFLKGEDEKAKKQREELKEKLGGPGDGQGAAEEEGQVRQRGQQQQQQGALDEWNGWFAERAGNDGGWGGGGGSSQAGPGDLLDYVVDEENILTHQIEKEREKYLLLLALFASCMDNRGHDRTGRIKDQEFILHDRRIIEDERPDEEEISPEQSFLNSILRIFSNVTFIRRSLVDRRTTFPPEDDWGNNFHNFNDQTEEEEEDDIIEKKKKRVNSTVFLDVLRGLDSNSRGLVFTIPFTDPDLFSDPYGMVMEEQLKQGREALGGMTGGRQEQRLQQLYDLQQVPTTFQEVFDKFMLKGSLQSLQFRLIYFSRGTHSHSPSNVRNRKKLVAAGAGASIVGQFGWNSGLGGYGGGGCVDILNDTAEDYEWYLKKGICFFPYLVFDKLTSPTSTNINIHSLGFQICFRKECMIHICDLRTFFFEKVFTFIKNFGGIKKIETSDSIVKNRVFTLSVDVLELQGTKVVEQRMEDLKAEKQYFGILEEEEEVNIKDGGKKLLQVVRIGDGKLEMALLEFVEEFRNVFKEYIGKEKEHVYDKLKLDLSVQYWKKDFVKKRHCCVDYVRKN